MFKVEIPIISIVTPTYNRAPLLCYLADSLEKQRAYVREWIIIDDGSKDDTRAAVDKYVTNASFRIVYEYQQNAGRMSAINAGVAKACGDLIVFMDSDDILEAGALEYVTNTWRGIPAEERRRLAGIVGLCADENGEMLDRLGRHTHNPLDTTLVALSEVYRMQGDRKEVLRRDIIQSCPYPLVDGERRIATSTIWPEISERYDIRFTPRILARKKYLSDGLSAKIDVHRVKSPISSARRYGNYLSYAGYLPIDSVFRNCCNFVRYCLHAGRIVHCGRVPPSRYWSVVVAGPIGLFLYLYDLVTSRGRK